MKPVPYQPDIKARGWSFDLDVERIEASDTWALAGNELQPWLLKTWYVSWKSQPAGSMPADPHLFAARIGMKWSQFEAARDVLMRGWWLADDGLLYHDTVTEKVYKMIGKRKKDVIKTNAWRAAQKEKARLEAQKHQDQPNDFDQTAHANVTSDTPVTHQSHTGESQAVTTPTPTPTPTPSPTEREQDKPATRSTGKQLTFAKWAEAERAEGRSLIADWEPLDRYMQDTGLTGDLVQLAWDEFRDRYTANPKYNNKRYIHWRSHFMDALRGNWFKLWFVRDGVYELSTVGQQAQREQAAKSEVTPC